MTARILIIFPILFLIHSAVLADTLNVANNGIDSNSCGSGSFPCRSISRAIVNAGADDLIKVGPGLYGDLDFDGDCDEVGEELDLQSSSAMIAVNKSVRIVSTHGAHATIISSNAGFDFTLHLQADSIRIGKKSAGFTIKSGKEASIFIEGSRARIFSNVISSSELNAAGIRAGCLGSVTSGNPDQAIIAHNSIVFNPSTGVTLCSNTSRFVLRSNDISNNALDGLDVHGSGHRILKNTINGNASGGASIGGEAIVFSKNILVGNGTEGLFSFSVDLHSISNTAIGNSGAGIYLTQSGAQSSVVSKSNVFGNYPAPGALYANCGLFDDGASSAITSIYYGASSGPGEDPADTLCSTLRTISEFSFVPQPFAIRIPRPVQ